MQKLQNPVLYIPGSSEITIRPKSAAKQDQKLCDALSWIALTFVREATGRDVAVCLNLAKPLELFVSDNLGSKQTPGDKDVTEFLIYIIIIALNALMKEKANYTPHTQQVYKKTIDRMVGLNWKRIGRKMAKISSVLKYHQPSIGLQRFLETELVLWAETRKRVGLPTEMFNALQKERDPKISSTDGDSNVALLKKSLSSIFDLSRRVATVATKDREKTVKSLYDLFVQDCKYVENSNFLNDPNRSSSNKEYMYPFVKLRRRIRNLTKYNAGAFSFLDDGIKYIQKLVGEHNDPSNILKFTFIGNSPGFDMMGPQKISWPKTPTIRNVEGASLWTENTQFDAHVHCETAMVYYIIKHGLPPLRVIGSSTPACNACNDFIGAVSGQTGTIYYAWKLPPKSTKEEYDWLMIPTNTRDPMKECFEMVHTRVKERAQIYIDGQQ